MFNAESFTTANLPKDLEEEMIKAANHSLAKKTWSSYKTAMKHLDTCQEETGRSFSLPMSSNDILLFTSWLLVRRGVRAATADCYLSAIRQVHIVKGHAIPTMRPEVVKSVLKGGRNQNVIKDRAVGRPTRLPVTPSMMKLIKKELSNMEIPIQRKRLIWLICSLNFFGGFRIHETLSRTEREFDPAFTLLARDVELKEVKVGNETEELLQLRLKSPKEDRVGASTFIDVYQTGGQLCPIRAYKKWKETNPPRDPDLPAFRKEDGTPLTGRKLNEILKTCLAPYIKQEEGHVSSHSFRSGMASLMATLGYTDLQIKAMGRWSSNAFEAYIKLPRRQRSDMAKDIARRGM